MESIENGPRFNIQQSLEKIGITNVHKIAFEEAYLTWAKENLDAKMYTALTENYKSVDVYKYTYLSDGLSIAGYLWTPTHISHPLPLIVWNRGGTGEYGSTGERTGGSFVSVACDLAKQGAIVIGSEYRGGIGSEGEDEWGGADLNDVITLKEHADTLPFVASKKALVAGLSRGGMMNYQLAAKMNWVKGVITLCGVTDLVASAKDRPGMEKVFNKSFGGSVEEMGKRSAVHFYQEIPKDLPLLILQGGKDERVSVEQVRRLHRLLEESGHSVEYHEFTEGDHGFYNHTSPYHDEVMKIITHFLEEHDD